MDSDMTYKVLDSHIGTHHYLNRGEKISSSNVLSGVCPFCNTTSGFKQVLFKSKHLTPLICDSCHLYVLYDHSREIVLPVAIPTSLDELPEKIDKYYQEALSCMAALSPSGAATLFRKLIHQVGIHYGVAKINENNSIMGIVEKLEKEGHVNKKLVEALRNVKDLGNDGAHVNENEPTMDQIHTIKKLIDSFLEATVLQDKNIQHAEESRKQPQN